MVISVNIPDSTERILAEQAALRGLSVEAFAADLIRKGVSGGRSFAEIMAPFSEQVAKSEIQDAELDCLFESARNEVYDIYLRLIAILRMRSTSIWRLQQGLTFS